MSYFVVGESPKTKNQERLIPPREGTGTNMNETIRGNKASWTSEKQGHQKTSTAVEIHMPSKTVTLDLCVECCILVHVSLYTGVYAHSCACLWRPGIDDVILLSIVLHLNFLRQGPKTDVEQWFSTFCEKV